MLTTSNKICRIISKSDSIAMPDSAVSDNESRGASQFMSRIFTDVNGRQFRLTFLVAVVNGELRGHLISAEPLPSSSPIEISLGSVSCAVNEPFCLPISLAVKQPATEYVASFAPVASPYYSLEFLINSQPTRAPSRR